MNATLNFYTAAYRDVKLHSIPLRNDDGSYRWSNGQEEILNQARFETLRNNYAETRLLEAKRVILAREILMCENPSIALEEEGEALAKEYQSEIDDEKLELKELKADLKNFEEDMSNRGHYFGKEEPFESSSKESKSQKKNPINWKVALGFVVQWLVGEVFMTYVQWSTLRDEKNIEDLVVRSLAFGVVLFLLHYVAHKNKKDSKVIYYVYMSFNLLMLLTMLFVPLTINKLYPTDTPISPEEKWRAKSNGGIAAKTEVPFLVEFYRSYEVTPAILSVLFFVAMMSFMKSKPKEEKESEVVKPKTPQDEIKEKRGHLKARIKECENRIEVLRNKLTTAIAPNTKHIADLVSKLEVAKAEILAADKTISELRTKNDTLLKTLEQELNIYQTEFLDILRSDSIKIGLITAEWPERNDIIQHFKI